VTEPVVNGKAESFYNEMKLTDKYTYSDIHKKITCRNSASISAI
jgi:hypothetical protein